MDPPALGLSVFSLPFRRVQIWSRLPGRKVLGQQRTLSCEMCSPAKSLTFDGLIRKILWLANNYSPDIQAKCTKGTVAENPKGPLARARNMDQSWVTAMSTISRPADGVSHTQDASARTFFCKGNLAGHKPKGSSGVEPNWFNQSRPESPKDGFSLNNLTWLEQGLHWVSGQTLLSGVGCNFPIYIYIYIYIIYIYIYNCSPTKAS